MKNTYLFGLVGLAFIIGLMSSLIMPQKSNCQIITTKPAPVIELKQDCPTIVCPRCECTCPEIEKTSLGACIEYMKAANEFERQMKDIK